MIAQRLKFARNACGLTQDDVALALGVDRSTYTYYETGRSKPSIKNLKALAKMYNVKISWLMGEEDDGTPSAGRGVLRDGTTFRFNEDEKIDKFNALEKDEKLLLLYYRRLDEGKKAHLIKGIKDKIEK